MIVLEFITNVTREAVVAVVGEGISMITIRTIFSVVRMSKHLSASINAAAGVLFVVEAHI